MDATKLKEYLKAVSDLETSIFRQEKVIEAAEESIKLAKPEKAILDEPINNVDEVCPLPTEPVQYVDILDKHLMEQYNKDQETSLWLLGGSLFFLFVYNLSSDNKLLKVFYIVALCISFAAGCYFQFGSRINLKKVREYNRNKDLESHKKFEKSYSEALLRREQLEKDYETQFQEYTIKKKTAEKEYKRACQNAKVNYENAKAVIQGLYKAFYDSKYALSSLYDLDIIFEKYRNIVAMTTIYEYFASGRCSELEGPNGAYNLYESELRQNLIVTKLDAIIDSLDEIKNNQFVLYKELSKMNTQISDVKTLTEQVVQNTERTADLTALNAELATITAGNTLFIAAATAFL